MSVSQPYNAYESLLLRDSALLGNVDTIQEFTQILLADVRALLNLCTSKRHKGNVVSAKLDLILNIGRANVLHALKKLHLANPLLSEEVTNFNCISVLRDIDGEMRVYEAHFVDEAAGDSHEHVVDVGADSADARKLLAVGEPDVDADALIANLAEVHVDVLEFTLQFAARPLDLDDARRDLNID